MFLNRKKTQQDCIAEILTSKLQSYRDAFSVRGEPIEVTGEDVLDALKRAISVLLTDSEYCRLSTSEAMKILNSYRGDLFKYKVLISFVVAYVSDRCGIDNADLIDSIASVVVKSVKPSKECHVFFVGNQLLSEASGEKGVLYGGGASSYLLPAVKLNRSLIAQRGSLWVAGDLDRADVLDSFASSGINCADVRFFDGSVNAPKLSLGNVTSDSFLKLIESATNEHQNSVSLIGYRSVFLSLFKDYLLKAYLNGDANALSLPSVIETIRENHDSHLIEFVERLINEARTESSGRFKVGDKLSKLELEQWRWLFADSMAAYNLVVQYCAKDGIDIVKASDNHLVFNNIAIANFISRVIGLQILDNVADGGTDFRVMFLEDCLSCTNLAQHARSFGLVVNYFFSGFSGVFDMAMLRDLSISEIYALVGVKVTLWDEMRMESMVQAMRYVSPIEGVVSNKILLV